MRPALTLIPLLLAAAASAQEPERGYLGVGLAPGATEEGQPAVIIAQVAPETPAEAAGLRPGDRILSWTGAPPASDAGALLSALQATLKGLAPGAQLSLELERLATRGSYELGEQRRRFDGPRLPPLDGLLEAAEGKELKLEARRGVERLRIEVTLGRRPKRRLDALPPLHPDIAALPEDPVARLSEAIITAAELGEARDDLLRRFAEDERSDDTFRSPLFRALHQRPTAASAWARGEVLTAKGWLERGDVGAGLLQARRLLGCAAPQPRDEGPAAPPPGASARAHLAYLHALMDRAKARLDAAFAGLSAEAREELWGAGVGELVARLQEHIYLHDDEDEGRRRRNLGRVAALAQVEVGALLEAAACLAPALDRGYRRQLEGDLRRAFADRLEREVLLAEDGPHGPVRILGTAGGVVTTATALLIDLGGDDEYRAPTAAGRGGQHPISLGIDFGGDDRYQATELGGLAAGVGGIGILIDEGGDDAYISSAPLTHGAAFAGIGLLLDEDGHDELVGADLSQGAGLACGLGWLVDLGGDDHYSAGRYAQGFAGPGALGWLCARGGDDRYVAGAGRSSYGTEGVLQGFAQGAACGFRTLASGGLGWLLESGGADRYLAGNFSQGGGYYFGLGMLTELGAGSDRYQASRYGQAFSAHSAGGILIDEGGDDRYGGSVGALQAAAWDLSFALLLEDAGDDIYDGPGGFSRGASAHNGFAMLVDAGGRDRARGSLGRSGPNDYHGGESLSLVLFGGLAEDALAELGAGRGRVVGRGVVLRPGLNLEDWDETRLRGWLGR